MSSTFDIARIERRDLPQVMFHVEENTEQGQIIGSIYDKISLPLDQRFQFSLPQNPFFKFDSEGSLLVAGILDREGSSGLCNEPGFPETCEWSSFLVDNGGNYISLRVHIEDVNDNAPSWSVPFVTITIPENSAPNFTTELSSAHDPDYGVNGIKEYKLIAPPVYEDLFMLKINPFHSPTLKRRQTRDQQHRVKSTPSPIGSPILVLLKPLDREKLPWINLTLLAMDGSPPYYTGALEIYVRVSDDNDHSPAFTFQRYVAQLPEVAPVGSTIQLRPISSSRQSDDNGVTGPLVNHLQAIDPDEGANGRVYYSFARSTPLETQKTFAIDSHTGQLRVARPLSYDDGPIAWNFQVVATDSGRPPRSSFTDVSIQLKDANNHPPSISIQSSMSYRSQEDNEEHLDVTAVRIRENVKLMKKHLATVTVNDRDTGEGGEFDCLLRSEDAEHFSLVLKGQLPQVMIYDLFVSGTFDREAEKIRSAGIFCEDKGSPRLSSSHQIRLLIEDENDNSPVFEFPFYRLTTKEAQVKGSVVGQVKASDADDGEAARLSYEIQWPKGTRPADRVLAIDRDGNLTAKIPLDRESSPFGYNLTVICRDNGTPSRSASAGVHLALLDVNDCIPLFLQSVYNFTLVEDYSTAFQGQRFVGIVHATDCDGPEFNRVVYLLLNSYHLFSIDREGRIFTTRSLDREQESVYELHVLATDRPEGIENPEDRVYTSEAMILSTPYNTATATVSVSIQDLNDNPPHFVHPANTSIPIRVSFQEDVGFVLTRMVAIDPDNGKNGTVSYRIVRGNRHGVFKLGEHSGDLYIGKKMVPEQVGTHTLRIEARDHGIRPQTSQTDVVVIVDASAPVGLHNDFLLGLGPNDRLIDGVGGARNSLGMSLLGTETMVVVYVIAGVVFVTLSLLIAIIVFCRRLRTRRDRLQRHWQRRQQQGQWQSSESKVNGFVEVNANTRECFQKTLNGYKPTDYDSSNCDGCETDNFKTGGNRRKGSHQIPSHLTDSSCYTIRMTSLPRHRPFTSNPTAVAATTTSAALGAAPTAFAYLLSSTTPATVNTAVTAASSERGGDFYLLPQSPISSADASVVGHPVTACINQLVGCQASVGKNHNTTELITLPISTEALVHTEIWTNDPKSSEAYVTLKPYYQLDGCLQNVHFVEPSVTTTAEMSSRAPKTEVSPPGCLLLNHHHHHHHHHQSSERPTDVYALTTELANATSAISILDPITGNRIFVPPLTANTGFLLPSPSAAATATTITNTNTSSSPSSGVITVSPDSSTTIGTEGGAEIINKLTSVNEGPSGTEEPT
ncbi:protocadherin 1 [Echinococcus multilocularis]|uniref:Protocadherin 1 n=1 Tax=Echinococcus multilocularis TaxID=6211 RepID=A0A087VZX6_ECHMU|nr:protocadherin 1 [Echinococcus multilocularis]